MFNQDVPDRRASSLAPLDPTGVAAALRPFGQSLMLPAEAYTSDQVFAWEQRNFFSGWMCVGRSADVAQPRDQRAERVGATSVLLVRGEDGELHAFANTCRHRGHELLQCGAATSKRAIVCPYHAWTYALDGSLRVAPGYKEVATFRPEEHGLHRLRVAEWHGYVFVDLSGTAPDLATYLGDLEERIAPYRTERLVVKVSHEYVIEANWKIISENYQECYHCPLIHPELCAVSPPDSGENWAFDAPGAWIGGWMELRDGMATMSLDGHSDGVPIPGIPPEAINRVDYIQVFPNLLISLHPDYVMTHRILPETPGRTWVECAWAFPPEAIGREGFDPAYAADFWDVTNRQDWSACESVQRGLQSGFAVPGPLSPQEDAVYQFVTMVARGYNGMPVHEKPLVGN
jgi:glycine betaine catabolism A